MYKLIPLLSLISATVPLIVGLYVFRSLSVEWKILVAYFAITLLGGIVQAYLGNRGINNLWSVYIIMMIEYAFLVFVFSYWQKKKILKTILYVSIPVFVFMSIGTMYLRGNLQQFNHYSMSIESIILVGISAYTLFEVSKESVGSLLREPRFLIATAVLVYFASTLILFALSNVLLTLPKQTVRVVFTFQVIMNIISNLIYAKGFLCQYQVQKSGGS